MSNSTPQSDETLDTLLKEHINVVGDGWWHPNHGYNDFKLALTAYIDAEVYRCEQALLDHIGLPTLQDVGLMPPEQYEGGLIINKWYQARIHELKKARGLPHLSTDEEK